MTTKIFNIKSALTARIIYKNISLFLNRLDKSNTLSGGAPQPPFIKIISKVVGGGASKSGGGVLKPDLLVLVRLVT